MSLPPFQTLLDAHGRDVHRLLVATVGGVDADDCYQETWITALRAYPRLRDASNLRSWILTVAHNKAIDHVRARARRATPVAELPEQAEPPASARAAPVRRTGDPAVILESQSEIWLHVRNLPPKQLMAVAMRFVADSSYAEISAAMGITEEAARRNVHEGLKRLRSEYTP